MNGVGMRLVLVRNETRRIAHVKTELVVGYFQCGICDGVAVAVVPGPPPDCPKCDAALPQEGSTDAEAER